MKNNKNSPENLSNNESLDDNNEEDVFKVRKRIQALDNDTKASKKIKSRNNNSIITKPLSNLSNKDPKTNIYDNTNNFSKNENNNFETISEDIGNIHINKINNRIIIADGDDLLPLEENRIIKPSSDFKYYDRYAPYDDKDNLETETHMQRRMGENNNNYYNETPNINNNNDDALHRNIFPNNNNNDYTPYRNISPNNNNFNESIYNNNNNNNEINNFDEDEDVISIGMEEENTNIIQFNTILAQKPKNPRNNTSHCPDSGEAITQNISFSDKSSGSFSNNSKENLEQTFLFELSNQEFEFRKKIHNSVDLYQTKRFPRDTFISLDDRSRTNLFFDESEETPRPVGRQDTVPVDILKRDTLSKIGILKSASPKYGDVWIIYDDLSVDSHDNVGSNFLMFGRSSENQNMAFTSHKISSKHCKIYVVKHLLLARYEVWVEDTSSNGTYINRELVGKNNKKLLRPEDTLHLYIPESSEDEEEISYVLKEMII
eukprot:TRINITY_DN3371_c0_g1_i1.p1 TRINITY_DN3371_c0_g1~~TRINITY_DN3371_c0_g1_i1.p1  ORF type:complete len:489 (+),score=159.13 TRINITY_DN3371_c0_g1_i1:85-1551(+)